MGVTLGKHCIHEQEICFNCSLAGRAGKKDDDATGGYIRPEVGGGQGFKF